MSGALPELAAPASTATSPARLRHSLRLLRLSGVLAGGAALASGLWLADRLGRRAGLERRRQITQGFLARLARALPYERHCHGRVAEGPMLWVCNHVSWCDVPLLGSLAPLSFLAKAEVRDWPLAGWLASSAGTQFIRRGGGESRAVAERLAGLLAEGHSLVLFPEGTTSDGRSVLPFHARLLESAISAGVPVQPVALSYRRDGAHDALAPFLGEDELPAHLGRLFGAARAEVHIHLLAPIASQGRSRRELADAAHEAIARALREAEQGAVQRP